MVNNQETIVSLLKNKFGCSLVGFCGCELGVWDAKTSVELLTSFPTLYLSMIDPWSSENIIGSMKIGKRQTTMDNHYKHSCKVTEFAADRRNVVRKRSMEAVSDFQDESLDFVFVDANHKYEYVKEDVNSWWPKIKPGGLLVGHDYNGNMERKHKLWGVKRAVDEFADKNGLEVVVHARLMFSIDKKILVLDG